MTLCKTTYTTNSHTYPVLHFTLKQLLFSTKFSGLSTSLRNFTVVCDEPDFRLFEEIYK